MKHLGVGRHRGVDRVVGLEAFGAIGDRLVAADRPAQRDLGDPHARGSGGGGRTLPATRSSRDQQRNAE